MSRLTTLEAQLLLELGVLHAALDLYFENEDLDELQGHSELSKQKIDRILKSLKDRSSD